MNKKIRVAVLYGGRSGEHEVSLESAASVVRNLDPDRFEVVPIGIDKQGQWFLNDLKQLSSDNSTRALPVRTEKHAALSAPGELQKTSQHNIEKNNAGNLFDVVFPVLHGPLGEDGTVQGIFELADIPYVGSNVLSSAIAMDKDITKRLVADAGLSVTPYISVKDTVWKSDSKSIKNRIKTELDYPVFVKPANLGSSVGIHKVKSEHELDECVSDAFLYDTKILIEKTIYAREIEIAVLENSDYGKTPLVSIPGEIIPSHEFYSYAAKYLDEQGAALVIPAPMTEEQMKTVQAISAKIFTVLECEGMARIDFLMDKQTGQFYFSETNTIPGFTRISMYPKLWEASGMPYSELLTHLIELAISRQKRKHQLKREWAIAESK